MNISEIKELLPNITVKCGGGFYVGNVRGRKNRFATVIFYPNGIETAFEAAWETVQRAHYNSHWINYD